MVSPKEYNPGNIADLCEEVKELVENGKLEQAEQIVSSSMSQCPHMAQPHNLMGIILECKEDHVGAMKHFRAACDLDPTYIPARYNLNQFGMIFISKRIYAFDESDCEMTRF